MRINLLVSCALLLCATCWGQGEYNIWTFGYGAGLDFNTDPPTPFTSELSSIESCGAICDAQGQLLFYTNGGASIGEVYYGGVWNANHDLMPNGSLNSSVLCQSSFFGPMIIPDPGNPDEYYIFHMDCSEHTYEGGLRYHKVDMTLEGGLGDVTEKDVFVHGPVNEGIVCIQHPNALDYWLLAKEYNSTNMVSILVTADGPQTPVVNTVATNEPPITISNQQGTQILLQAIGSAHIYDFNDETGVLSLANTFQTNRVFKCYSPNGQFAYSLGFDGVTFDTTVIQADLSDPDNVTEVQVGSFDGSGFPIQIGPDGKIYIAHSNTNILSVIQNPDALGLACVFTADGVDLGPELCSWGFPVFPILADPPTSISSLSEPGNVVVYPNPAKDILNVQSDFELEHVRITDSNGRVVLEQRGGNKSINLGGFSAGVYSIALTGSSSQVVRSFVKLE
jgi:hypothetical protein